MACNKNKLKHNLILSSSSPLSLPKSRNTAPTTTTEYKKGPVCIKHIKDVVKEPEKKLIPDVNRYPGPLSLQTNIQAINDFLKVKGESGWK